MRRRTVLGTGLAVGTAVFLLPRATVAEDAAGQMLEMLHSLRQGMNLQSLHQHPALTEMARLQTLQMHRIRSVTHTGPDDSDPPRRGLQAGYRGRILGEALAASRTGPAETVDHWLADTRTRAVLLDPKARQLGIFGLAPAPNIMLWALVFGAA